MTREGVQRTARVVSAVLVSALVFLPFPLSQIASLRVFALAFGVVAVAVEILLGNWSLRWRLLMVAVICTYLVTAVATAERIAGLLEDRLFAVNFEHLLGLMPLYALLGFMLCRSESRMVYVRTLLAFASVISVLAILEALLRTSLTGRDHEFLITQREGLPRALATGEGPLTLGASFTAMVPLTLLLSMPRVRIACAAVLVCGTWATGSRGPALICTAVAILQSIPIARRLLQKAVPLVHLLVAAVIIVLAVMSTFVWRPYIAGATGVAYSSNYRGALYSILPRLLSEHPFGYLLVSPPPGRWMVGSQLHGSFDITRSVDSEIVFAAFGLGWLGLGLFLAALFLSIQAIRRSVPVGLSSLSLTGLGFTLALHGWDGMSPLWYSLVGACAAIVFAMCSSRIVRRAVTQDGPESGGYS